MEIDYSEQMAIQILEKQKGQILYEESGKYLEVSVAVDRYLAGELFHSPGLCIVCDLPVAEKEKFCKSHSEIALAICYRLAGQLGI